MPNPTQARNGRTLLLWGNPKERQALFKVLCATGSEVRYDHLEGETDGLTNYRLVIIDYDALRQDAVGLLQDLSESANPPPVLVITSSRDKQDLIDVLSHEVLTNLFVKNNEATANELVVTVQKIIRNDIFGFEKYLTWGVQPREVIVTCSEQKPEIIERLTEYLKDLGCNRRLIELAKGVGDEFLMNAVYNAPVGQDGKTKYASLARTERVELQSGEEVRFRFACDGRMLALSVEDNFGRLDSKTVRSYLRKCFAKDERQIDEKDGGAGLGLYHIYESLNQFVINVAPEKKTELIGILDVSGSYKDFAERPKSLHLFLEGDQP